jgi:glyoxylase-like metal-dependent hydrolase (beta-lactamase superfamily II)
MQIETFFDPRTSSLTHVVHDPATRDAIVIDPVLDYEPVGSKVFAESLAPVIACLHRHDLKLHYILETHAHADHLSGSQLLRRDFPGALLAIGAGIVEVQRIFKHVFALGDEIRGDGGQFDHLIVPGEQLRAGSLTITALATPGHTPACLSYLIDDAVFTGDALFMPDYGTGRCDFPGGDSRTLYRSVHANLYTLPDATRVFVGHDYQPNGRALAYQTTIGESKRNNVHLFAGRDEQAFVDFRSHRDASLDAPRLLYPSVQVNIDAGRLPAPDPAGRSFFKIPIKQGPSARRD